MNSRLPLVQLATLCLAMTSAASCGTTSTELVKPWFKVEVQRPTVIAPHALVMGHSGETGSILIGDRWKELSTADGSVRVTALGERVVLDDTYAGLGIRIYSRGNADPTVIPRAACPSAYVRATAGAILCMGCGGRPPFARPRTNQTVTRVCADDAPVTATFYDGTGRVVWTRTATAPVCEPKAAFTTFVIEASKRGDPVLHFACPTQWTSRFFVLGDSGGFEERAMRLGDDGYEELHD